jgi:PTH2 family peptidyl-tRNA hydrolase
MSAYIIKVSIMSNLLTIFVRNDLKMRKGKMAAQSAHAAMKLFFESMLKSTTRMTLLAKQNSEFLEFFNNPVVNICMVQDEAVLMETLKDMSPVSIIVDNGRTEFHGVPTTTCAANGIFSPCDLTLMNVPQTYGTEIKSKQIFIFNKDKPLSKEKACQHAVISCLKLLYSQMSEDEEGNKYFDITQKNALTDWIMNAFAKIALSTKTMAELDEVELQLKAAGFVVERIVDEGNDCLCVSPQYPNDIDPITRHLSLI